MIKAGPNNTDQLTTSIDRPQVRPLVVAPIPLLRASLHLSRIVGSQGQALETTTSGHRPGRNEVIEGETVKGSEHTPQTLHSLEDRLGRQISPVRIVTGGPSILDIVMRLEALEAFCPSIVDILGIGDELRRRRRSVRSRHVDVEDGLMV